MLRAHTRGPRRRRHLQEAARSFAEATIRDAVGNLCELGALERHGAGGARNAVATSLTPFGEELLVIADALEDWLGHCPMGPIKLVDGGAKVAVKALAEAWSSTLTREVAIAPRTLTELSSLIPAVSYPALERRIGWMRSTGQVSPLSKDARGTRYVPDDWLRLGVAPLALASRCEQRCVEDALPMTGAEVEALFLLSLPLVRLAPTAGGGCVLASSIDSGPRVGEGVNVAGVAVEVEAGEIALCGPADLDTDPGTWAIGTCDAWLDAVIEGRFGRLRIGGANPRLARELARGIHHCLFVKC